MPDPEGMAMGQESLARAADGGYIAPVETAGTAVNGRAEQGREGFRP